MTAPRSALLRPDQAAAAVVLAQAGSSIDRIADTLAVPVDVVTRSLRLPAGAEEPAPGVPMELGPVLVVGDRLSVRKLPRPLSWRAPVYVEDDASWPPSPTADDRWQVVHVLEGQDWAQLPLREVDLWDARILVDDQRRVFCGVCRRLVGVVELGRNLFRGQDGVAGGGLPSHTLSLPREQS